MSKRERYSHGFYVCAICKYEIHDGTKKCYSCDTKKKQNANFTNLVLECGGIDTRYVVAILVKGVGQLETPYQTLIHIDKIFYFPASVQAVEEYKESDSWSGPYDSLNDVDSDDNIKKNLDIVETYNPLSTIYKTYIEQIDSSQYSYPCVNSDRFLKKPYIASVGLVMASGQPLFFTSDYRIYKK